MNPLRDRHREQHHLPRIRMQASGPGTGRAAPLGATIRVAALLGLLGGLLLPASVLASGTPGSGREALRAGAGSKAEKSPQQVPVLTFNRSGGVAGLRHSWQIYSTGLVRHFSNHPAENSTTAVSADSVQLVVGAILKAGFMEMEQPPMKDVHCADCYIFSLNVRQGDVTRTLYTNEMLNTPRDLEDSLEMVARLIEQAGFQNPYDLSAEAVSKDGRFMKKSIPLKGVKVPMSKDEPAPR